MDSEKVWQLLEEVRSDSPGQAPEETTALVLRGLTPEAVRALDHRPLVIRYFPFFIGRAAAGPFSMTPDLLLSEEPPYRLSRRHLTVERRGEEIFLVDTQSRSGTLVDDVLLGGRQGGITELRLAPGMHDLRLGGSASPYHFSLSMEKLGVPPPREEQVVFGGRTLPAGQLYGLLHHYVETVFRTFFQDRLKGLEMAAGMVEALISNWEAIDPLYYFTASPQVRGDVIVSHCLNVAVYTLKFAAVANVALSAERKKGLALAALFHDIGMYDLPPEIVNKTETVTAAEYELIKGHPQKGHSWLIQASTDEFLLDVLLNHHERIDGVGYPRGITDVSQETEIVALVDFFEALTHYRPQRGPITPHEGIRRLIDLKEALFRPPLLEQFVKVFSIYPVFSVVRLSSGEIGQVVGTDPAWPLRPRVRIFFDRNGRRVEKGLEVDLAENPALYVTKDISDRIFVDRCFKL